jgi:hypothetical protein
MKRLAVEKEQAKMLKKTCNNSTITTTGTCSSNQESARTSYNNS